MNDLNKPAYLYLYQAMLEKSQGQFTAIVKLNDSKVTDVVTTETIPYQELIKEQVKSKIEPLQHIYDVYFGLLDDQINKQKYGQITISVKLKSNSPLLASLVFTVQKKIKY